MSETLKTTSHIPVLLQSVLDALLPAEHIIDGTLGAGGHSGALLAGNAGEILGLDADPAALAIARANLAQWGTRMHFAHTSYVHMAEAAQRIGWEQVDGILLDLGLSSMQLDQPERGFAFRYDAPLDMRFDPTSERPTAAELVNHLDVDELADIFFQYGEERLSRKIASAIVRARPIHTTRELAALVERVAPRHKSDKIHPATRIFQALRIAVNDELGILERALPIAIDLLRPGGHLAVISFHSLEDRIVKQAFKLASTDCICPPEAPVCVCDHHATVRLVNRKPIEADAAEVERNPRSRSAKLRVVEKLDDHE
jgi:16S rRNA (cytosine1402-N4)-methyltransferase